MSVNKSQILSNLGQEFAKQALTTQTAQGTTETNWPLIIGIGAIVCCCCLSSSGLLGYLIYEANKEPFNDDYRQYDTANSDGSYELRNLIILVLLGLLLLYFLRR